MIIVGGLALIALCVGVIVGVFFLGGKRPPKPQPGNYNKHAAANAASNIAEGATNKRPARTTPEND